MNHKNYHQTASLNSRSLVLTLFFKHLPGRYRIFILALVISMVIAAACDMLTILLIVPLVSVVAGESSSSKQATQIINSFVNIDTFGIRGVAIVFLALVVASLAIRSINLYFTSRYTVWIGGYLARTLLKRILESEFTLIGEYTSGEYIATLTVHIANVASGLFAILTIVSGGITSTFLLGALFSTYAIQAIFSILLIGSFYLLIVLSTEKIFKNNSTEISRLSSKNIQQIQESIGSIREIKLYGLEDIAVRDFASIDRRIRLLFANNNLISTIPKYFLESFAFIVLCLVSVLLYKQGQSEEDILPMIGVFALAFQKILPACQQCFSCWSQLQGVYGSFAEVSESLSRFIHKKVQRVSLVQKEEIAGIVLEQVSFGHPNRNTLYHSLNISILVGEIIGLRGSSGSGKTSLLELVCGLYQPTKGRVYLLDIKGNRRLIRSPSSWEGRLGYVPQHVYLFNATLAENIAIGEELDAIDMDLVHKVASLACLADFISSLPKRYMTSVGEGGSRLSGGQRQRLGIARVLYRKANVILLDEATSALDPQTELDVLNSIGSSCSECIVIMTAHRTAVLERCDRVIDLDKIYLS